jgi:hypothetical protein
LIGFFSKGNRILAPEVGGQILIKLYFIVVRIEFGQGQKSLGIVDVSGLLDVLPKCAPANGLEPVSKDKKALLIGTPAISGLEARLVTE